MKPYFIKDTFSTDELPQGPQPATTSLLTRGTIYGKKEI